MYRKIVNNFEVKLWQWLGSYCNQRGTRCCYPPTGNPNPDFTIYGLWPYYNGGSFPYNCGDDNYDVARVCTSISYYNLYFSINLHVIALKYFLDHDINRTYDVKWNKNHQFKLLIGIKSSNY